MNLPNPTWRLHVAFFAPGLPKGQPRPRAFARQMGARAVARMYDSGTAEGWKGDIALAARRHRPAAPLVGPVRVDVDVFFPRPKRLCGRKCPDGPIPHTAKPDRDNLDKAILDCLTRLGFWLDDAQVCGGGVGKWYVARGQSPGAFISISTSGDTPVDSDPDDERAWCPVCGVPMQLVRPGKHQPTCDCQ